MNNDLRSKVEDERILALDKDIEKSKKEADDVIISNNYYKYTETTKSSRVPVKEKISIFPLIIGVLLMVISIALITR